LCTRFQNGGINDPSTKEGGKLESKTTTHVIHNDLSTKEGGKSESKTTTNDPSTNEGGKSESKTTKYSLSPYRSQPQNAADGTKERSASPDGISGRSTSSPGDRVGSVGGLGNGSIFSLFVH